jgi:hypothetical protein
MPIKPKPLPPVEALQALFRYEPETGAIYSKTANTNRRLGERCDRLSANYLVVYVAPKLYLAHRVAWKLYYCTEPPFWLDHINGDRLDNRIANLREATHAQNMCNRSVASHSLTGVKGVSYRGKGKWRAYLVADGKKISLGNFSSLEAAGAAVSEARQKAHGDFASD